ncbi:proline-specific peptidase [Rhodocollybia butyracea]|uniref:Proline-specific peptidase n=1 Tax=Rhodocollybia butyracea TaxID=206335 RepID=A0A9P5TXB6_9AGAR|nr:proline-specific peptidase [Rhodocollybia butyracea]
MPSPLLSVTEGKICFIVDGESFETYYKLAGDLTSPGQVPIVVLHGGPGVAHNYMSPLLDLGKGNQSVILYDQLGQGNSTHLQSKPISFWTIDLFIIELENLLTHFSISGSFHLIGHSWGATLASEFVVRKQPPGLKRLVLSNGLASARLRNEAIAIRRKSLPVDVQEVLKTHEEAGTTQSPEYNAAMMVFHQAFTCRTIRPLPEDVLFSIKQNQLDPTVINAMRNGSAGLKDSWEITDRVHLIRVPTLVINGEYDYMMDSVCAPFFSGIPDVKWVKFAESGHFPHWDERERYMETVLEFLQQ